MGARLSSSPEHRIAVVGLAGVLVAGAVLRGLFMVAWRPAFMGWPDAKSYIDVAHGDLFSSTLRPAGYPLFLRLLDVVDPDMAGVVLVNHALGLGAALLLYLAVVRAGAPRPLGLVPAAIVALNGDTIFLEHSPLSEPLFIFLIALGLYAAVRTLDVTSALWPAVAGVALACSATVRVVGLALVPVLVLWLLVASQGALRRRVAFAAVAALGALAILGGYYVAEERAVGKTGLSRHGVWHLYGRVAPFADCSRFSPPPGTEVLCEATSRDQRPITDAYIFNWWYSPAVRAYDYPFASTPEVTAALSAFSWAVVFGQPLDYLGEVSTDMLRYVAPESLRGISGGPSYADLVGTPILFNPVFEGEGLTSVRRYYGWRSRTFEVNRPLLRGLRVYESATRIQGPLMVVLAVLSLAAPFVTRGRARCAALLLTLSAWALLVAPVAALQFSARTAVPAFGALG
ncbi:MAG: phospholipid carrier-dependent glycosyltransferase, partial [Actinomycetota bacterium]|nr:phospholipid carrier-dependent glycosyltransferase [Actinomycetota bacterium]